MDGVAYTTGSELDNEHKEMHMSLGYVASQSRERVAAEVRGVVVHEMVHAWQWDGRGSAPGGLIEGVADWVRLGAGLAPPHWKRGKRGEGTWDAGYQRTAYFLEWVEKRYGEGSVVRMNGALRERYEEGAFWEGLFGESVDALWDEYSKTLPHGEFGGKEDEVNKMTGGGSPAEGTEAKS